MEKIYYLDNAATTKVFDEEFEIMRSQNENGFYNPSSAYKVSIDVKKTLDKSREKICRVLGGQNGKLIFTSSATESNNLVFEGVHLKKTQEILISVGEHPAVYNSAHRLEKQGIIVKDIALQNNGCVDFEDFKRKMTKDVALVSIMHVSNETGAVNDIKKLCEFAKSVNRNVIFHSDGVQAFCKEKVDMKSLGVDLYTISGHKIHAPRGISALWVKNGVVLDALLVGGGQEQGLRSSTENVAGAVAFAYATCKLNEELDENQKKVNKVKSEILNKLKQSKIAEFMKINAEENSSPYIMSISFKNIKGEVLMNLLEMSGILISTGSACSSKKAGNRTLEAMGLDNSWVIGSVRLSFSAYENYDVDYIAQHLVDAVLRLESNNKQKR